MSTRRKVKGLRSSSPGTRSHRPGYGCTRSPCRCGGLCWAHDPQLVEARRAARLKGGHGKSRVARLSKLVPPRLMKVYGVLETALSEVHERKITPQVAGAMAGLASAMVRS